MRRDIEKRKERKTARAQRRNLEVMSSQVLSLIDGREMEALARETGFYGRSPREIRALEFVLCCALAATVESKRGFATVWRLLGAMGVEVARSAVTQRFTAGAARLMEAVFIRAVARLPATSTPDVLGKLEAFRAVLAQDGSVVTLSPLLKKLFPATRTNSVAAAGKVHATADVVNRRITDVVVTGERTSELAVVRAIPIVPGALYLQDLGYFCHERFGEIVAGQGHVVSRLKENSNPFIVGIRHGFRAPAELLAKHPRLDDEEVALHMATSRTTFDLDVEVEGDKQRRIPLRLVGCFNAEAGRIHWYLTSLPAESFSPEEVATLYALRWVVELMFKLLKSSCHLDHVDTSSPDALRAHIYASLLAATVLSAVTTAAAAAHGLAAGYVSPLVVGQAAALLVLPLLGLWLERSFTPEELATLAFRLVTHGCVDQNPNRTRAKWNNLARR